MQISSRFTIALHILSCIEAFQNKTKVTSSFLAGSININPVTVRNILLQLKAAGFIRVERGSGGAFILKPLDKITFLDVYRAIEPLEAGVLFRFHENPNPECPIGRSIHKILDRRLADVQNAMEQQLRQMTVADMLDDFKKIISDETE